MPKTRQQKEKIVADLNEKLKGAKSVVIADFNGLDSEATAELRNKAYESKVEFMAVKKTLLGRVFKDSGLEMNANELSGSIAIALSADEVAAAKMLKDFAKTHEQLTFQGGMLEGAFISIEKVKELANLPTKLELLSKLVGSLNAPISGFVTVLNGNLRGLVTVLDAIKAKKV